jgi:glycosyltransferase involved in cell wall biosynthesis
MVGISVVIPTYNRARLLPETLAAILAQTLAADEVIVVDDGSTDDTQAVLAGYGDRLVSIRIVNSGEHIARNTGLRAATGHLVAFCDSDDIWTPDFLQTMSAQWQAVPNLVACYADFRILQDGARSAGSKFDDAPQQFWSGLRATGPGSGVFDQDMTRHLLAFQPFFPSCMMVSRARFLAMGGWDEGVGRIVGADFATALRMAANPPLGVVRHPLAAIRKHDGNYSRDTEKMNLGDAQVLDYVLRTRPELAPLEAAIRASAAARRQAALDSAFARRDFTAFRQIRQKLPGTPQTAKQRAKHAIAALPAPLNSIAAALVMRAAGRFSA